MSYRDVVTFLTEQPEIRRVLEMRRVPDPATLCHAAARFGFRDAPARPSLVTAIGRVQDGVVKFADDAPVLPEGVNVVVAYFPKSRET